MRQRQTDIKGHQPTDTHVDRKGHPQTNTQTGGKDMKRHRQTDKQRVQIMSSKDAQTHERCRLRGECNVREYLYSAYT